MARLLGKHADIVGLYNVGAGTQGVAKALSDPAAASRWCSSGTTSPC